MMETGLCSQPKNKKALRVALMLPLRANFKASLLGVKAVVALYCKFNGSYLVLTVLTSKYYASLRGCRSVLTL